MSAASNTMAPNTETKQKKEIDADDVVDEASFLEYLKQLACEEPSSSWQNLSLQDVLRGALSGLADARKPPTSPWYIEFQKKNPWQKMAELLELGIVYE